ncbi:pirin family protein [bacterium]|nr:pirin family protein [bacterium]
MATSQRSVTRIVPSIHTIEGDGMEIRRPFPTQLIDSFDPFLLLDHFGPVEVAPGEAKGTLPHPHRGFETVTYIIEGEFEHKDSAGHAGRLTPGAVQWMTAGHGIIHSEQPSASLMRYGGRLHGLQLWVNLPARDKMMPPRYQELPAERIPVASSEDGSVSVRVIAGEALGVSAVIETRTPIMYLHFTLQPGARHTQPVPPAYNAFAYVIGGEGHFGSDEATGKEGEALFFGAGDEVTLSVPEGASAPLSVLLLAGVPLKERIYRYGPFVMNTQEQLLQAFRDYEAGHFDVIPS